MLKNIAVGAAGALVAAIALAVVAEFSGWVRDVTAPDLPKGAVVAFDLAACPSDEWEEYKLAYGRFIRGIDKSGENIDPQGERNPGSHQDGEFKAHAHDEHPAKGNNWHTNYQRNDPQATWGSERGGNKISGLRTAETGGPETRPKNVALLYCEKI